MEEIVSFYCYMYLQVHCSSAEHARKYFDSSMEYESCIISYHYSHLVVLANPKQVIKHIFSCLLLILLHE